jgi:hypothetical protein
MKNRIRRANAEFAKTDKLTVDLMQDLAVDTAFCYSSKKPNHDKSSSI